MFPHRSSLTWAIIMVPSLVILYCKCFPRMVLWFDVSSTCTITISDMKLELNPSLAQSPDEILTLDDMCD